MTAKPQNRVFGKQKRQHTIIVASGDTVRHMTVRPWMAALAVCLVGVFSIGYLLATSYLVLRDDLIGATMARQARMQYDYEDRIAALRAQVDRVTSRQLLDQQVDEEKVDKLMEQQQALSSRHGKLDALLDRAENSGLMNKDVTGANAAAAKGDHAELTGGLKSIEKLLSSGRPADATPDNSTLAYVPAPETVADHADRVFSRVTLSLKHIEQDQLTRVRHLTTGASETVVVAEQDLVLTPPEPVKVVAPEKASGLVPVEDTKKNELEKRVEGFIDDLIAQDVNSPEFGKRVDAIAAMGQKEIRDAAGQSNRFLDRPVRAMSTDTGVGADLLQLRKTVEELDPGRNGKLIGGNDGFLSKLFGGSPLKQYFRKYQSSQSHIQGILKSLSSGKDELLMDNAAIDTERANLWNAMGRLEQMIYLSKAMDTKLEDKANELDHTDPAKAKAIRETALFYVRQRTQDLLTQMAVTVQGYLALDLVKKNNVELVKGVDRASTTTVSALRTAVTVAQALTNQKLVLDQITAINTTTAGLIDSTGQLLKSNTAAIHEQAANSTIPVETLQRAFQNIYDTMDAIDTFKLKALDSMKTTVNTLSNEVEKSKGYIARAEGAAQNQGGAVSETFKLEAM